MLGMWKTYFENICRIECQQEKSVLCLWRGRGRFFIFVQIKSKWHFLFYALLLPSACHFSDFPLSADLEFQIQILQ